MQKTLPEYLEIFSGYCVIIVDQLEILDRKVPTPRYIEGIGETDKVADQFNQLLKHIARAMVRICSEDFDDWGEVDALILMTDTMLEYTIQLIADIEE